MRKVPLHALTPVEDVPADDLVRCWVEALGAPPPGADVGFLQAGGHSLAAIRLSGSIARRWGVRIPLTAFLRDDISLTELRRHLPAGAPHARAAVARRPDPSRAALSPDQRRIWMTQLIFPDSPAYNVIGALDCRGGVDPTALEKAWHRLVTQYEVLRTTVEDDGGGLYQCVHDDMTPSPGTFRHRTVPPAGNGWDEQVSSFAGDLADLPFDSGQLPRAVLGLLTETGAERFAVVLVMDHLISDMASLDLMWDALGEHYAVESGARQASGEVLQPIQYGDLIAAIEDDPGHRARSLAFWRSTLSGAASEFRLPFQAARPERPSFRGAAVTEELPDDVSRQLRQLGKARRVSPAMPVLASYAHVLARWGQQSDVVIGVPVSGRESEDAQETVGFFMRTVPLRLRVPAGPLDAELVETVADALLSAVEHSSVPFDEIVAAVGAPRDLARNPLFQVWFNDVTQAASRTSFGAHQSRAVTPRVRWSLFDLGLYVHRAPSGTYRLELAYATDLWHEATARRFLTQCVSDLRSLVTFDKPPAGG
ncbi:condensation domain-containing protein [Streptomyces sp. NPDC018045]|uniref:condensation domain-containing protein n=1 Tax=Streptomyces sp. NPDC018045 TaxID=3365037 RepID=UPI0037A42683